jgi:hypothetical protein
MYNIEWQGVYVEVLQTSHATNEVLTPLLLCITGAWGRLNHGGVVSSVSMVIQSCALLDDGKHPSSVSRIDGCHGKGLCTGQKFYRL